MTYRLLKKADDEDIPLILSVYKQPSISRFISIDEENYWKYITSTENVYFYKIYKDDILLATIHLELGDCVLYMSVVVFPEFQKQGIATTILKDMQAGKLGLDFDKIQVSIDENNTASIKLFESAEFVCVGKDEELWEYEYTKS
ncbi:MAG: GNAT family N-acetyltransferase [Oscillospiraceae bacterium]|nr:GNAT family N-acetyltransferase [Oscillospiraceae bacterium]